MPTIEDTINAKIGRESWTCTRKQLCNSWNTSMLWKTSGLYCFLSMRGTPAQTKACAADAQRLLTSATLQLHGELLGRASWLSRKRFAAWNKGHVEGLPREGPLTSGATWHWAAHGARISTAAKSSHSPPWWCRRSSATAAATSVPRIRTPRTVACVQHEQALEEKRRHPRQALEELGDGTYPP